MRIAAYIVNVDCIELIGTDFILVAGEEIPLGRTYREAFIERFVKGKLIERKLTWSSILFSTISN
ncbi:MAG: hypothetical protein AAF960_23820 [Bacteroidota bacterium]